MGKVCHNKWKDVVTCDHGSGVVESRADFLKGRVDVRVRREDGNSIAGSNTSLKKTICKVLYPLCPSKNPR
jgi:hypothetical protein